MEDLLQKAAELSAAIEEHARVVTGTPDDYPRVAAALNRLRSSALGYATACAEQTGWGDPFSDLEDDLTDEPEQGGEPDVVRVEARYEVRVNDLAAAARLLDEPVQADAACSDVVAKLFVRDGWNPEAYGETALSLVRHSWSAGPEATD
ncbi:hypothetical protein ABT294_12405 [Nonomuraea sp. NPDC000554]|uniref:hypothetical protein n=1 Tax=Nonomuraea sp. NPDC000554 TaxID=3154259 RepID=UPI00332C17F4